MPSTRRAALLAPGLRQRSRPGPITAAGVFAVAVLLTACTGQPSTSPSASPSLVQPSPSATPTPTPTPTADGPIDRSDRQAEIYFEDLPDVTGHLREALDLYTLYEVESHRSLAEGEVSAAFRSIAAPDIVRKAERHIASNKEGGWTVSGPTTVRIVAVDGVERAVSVDACVDSRKRIFTSADETGTGSDFGFGRALVRTQLVKVGSSPWSVMSWEDRGKC